MTPIFPGPAYRVVTSRTVLRCYNPADAPLLSAAAEASQEHLLPWMPWASEMPDLQARIAQLRSFRAQFDRGESFVYGIFDPSESRVLGGCGLHLRVGPNAREIGYWIHKDFINQGYATEIAAALTKVAFEVDEVGRVEIHCAHDNVRSAAVPRKLGYTLEATLRERSVLPDGVHDSLIWSLLAREYPATPCAQAEIQAFDAMGRKIL
jgi:RimJ/RimL family protein N-acetyltransferase